MKSVPRTTGRSRALHRIDRVTSRAMTSYVVAAMLGAFLVAAAIAGFPESWLLAFHVVVGAVTVFMVFVIQHTQSREQTATQMKLDELIRAVPPADDHLVHIEAASDQELSEREHRDLEHHTGMRDGS